MDERNEGLGLMDKYSLSWRLVACACVLTVMLLVITTQRSSGYELSIYAGLNVYAFVPLALAAVVSYVWVIRGRLWAFNTITMIFCVMNVIFISLPSIKGYYMLGQADSSSFVGYVVDILRNGTTYYNDFYPLAHILVSQLSLILGTEPRVVLAILSPVMWGIFALGTSLAAKQIEHHHDPLTAGVVRGLACVFWLPAFFGYTLPFFMTLELSAIVVYLLLWSFTTSRTLVLIILLFSMPLYHPLTAVLLMISMLAASALVTRPFSVIFRRRSVLIAVTLGAWIVYFAWFRDVVTAVSNMFTAEARITGVAQTLGKLNLSLIGTIELGAKLYGHGALALGLAVLSYPIMAKYAKGNARLRTKLRILYPFAIVSSASTFMFLLVGNIGFTPFRFYWFAVLSSLPAAIWTFLYLVRRIRDVRLARFLALTIIVLLWVSSLASLYPSPYVITPNDQVTYEMMHSMHWIQEYHPSYRLAVAPFNSYSTKDLYISVSGWSEYETQKGYRELSPILPDHLAYGNVDQIRALYASTKGPIYVTYDTSVTRIYQELYPQLQRYTPEDIQVFLSNPSVGKICDNGESQVSVIFAS
jgi:hypothetical protein